MTHDTEAERSEFLTWLRIKPCGAAHDFAWEAWRARAALAATQPVAQGMDAQRWQIVRQHISGEYIAGHACFVVRIEPVPGANIMRGSVAQHFTKAVDDRAKQIKIAHQAWLAAQAKQGGA